MHKNKRNLLFSTLGWEGERSGFIKCVRELTKNEVILNILVIEKELQIFKNKWSFTTFKLH